MRWWRIWGWFYIYNWFTVPGNPSVPGDPTVSSISSLDTGTFGLAIRDLVGCLDTTYVSITEPEKLIPSISETVHVFCNGDASGKAVATATGGIIGDGYFYLWDFDASQTTNTVEDLIAGTYKVFVNDQNDCLDST